MELTVKEIAERVRGHARGDAGTVIRGAAGIEEATKEDITFVRDAKNPAVLKSLSSTQAGAVIVPRGLASAGKTVVEVENPTAAFADVLGWLVREKRRIEPGIHPLAYVAKSAKISPSASVGPFCVVEEDAEIGDDTCLTAHVYVGARSRIGKNTLLYSHVTVREEISIGNGCILHPGAVIGSDGFGFYFAGGRHNKIPQIGTVIVEDNVEIGAGTTIDRATTGATILRTGTKIDNLVQVAHNVEVGPHAILVAQVGIAGSSKVGVGCVLAGQVGVADHVKIGDGAQVGAQSGIKDNVDPGAVLFGTPAQPIGDALRQTLLIRRLPELFKDVKNLKETRERHG